MQNLLLCGEDNGAMNTKNPTRLTIILLAVILIPLIIFAVELGIADRAALLRLLAGLESYAVIILVGVILVGLVGVGLFVLRAGGQRSATRVCPRCGQELHRIHRMPLDKFISRFVHVHRYRCANPRCRWEGILRRQHRPRTHSDSHPRSAGAA